MADLDHNLSLADALTEPPPQIEEEVKRDFIATLEAEKFDDVIGEKVDKTDYVPLLDDDDPKAGNQEAKTKPHADNVQVERKSATGPAAVVENGDHGVEGPRKVSTGKIMDEQMSYKEFLDRNSSWTMDDRHHFESQPVFKPMDITEPFKMNREDVLSDLLLLPQEMMSVPPFGEYFGASEEGPAPFGAAGVPEQPHSLGAPHSPANIFDPLAFLGGASGAGMLLNQSQAAPGQGMGSPEDFWLGSQHLMAGQGAPFFEPPVPSKIPEVAEMHMLGSPSTGLVDFTGQPKLPEVKPSPPAAFPSPVGAGPDPAVEELMGFEPSFDCKSLLPKQSPTGFPEAAATKEPKVKTMDTTSPGAGSSSALGNPGESKPLPGQHKEKEESSQSPSKEEASKTSSSKKVEEVKSPLSLQAEEKAAATQPLGPKAEDGKPSLTLSTEKKESKLPSPSAEEPKPAAAAQHIENASETKDSPTQLVQEVADKPSTHKTEEVKVFPPKQAEKVEENKAPSAPKHPEKPEDSKSPSAPKHPEKPEETKSPVPKHPEKPEESKSPSASKYPEKPEESKSPSNPKHPEKSEESKSPSAPKHPEKPEESKSPSAPKHPEKPEESKSPSASKHSEKPEESKSPSNPKHPEKPEESKASPREEVKTPTSLSQSVEQFPRLDKPDETNKKAPSASAEKPEEEKQPLPAKPVEHLLEPAVPSKETVSPGVSPADAKETLAEKPASVLAEAAKPKETPEPCPVQPAELIQGKGTLEPAGLPPAQIRQANKSSDHHRFSRTKPARVTASDAPEELLVGFPAQKSQDRGGEDPFSMAEYGYIAGTSPRSKASTRKAASQPFEFGEVPVLREGWDLETSAALKKKKKKPKQKRSQQVRVAEIMDSNSERLQAPCAPEPHKAELPLPEPHESMKGFFSASTEILGKEASSVLRDVQSLTSVPAKGKPTLQMEGPSQLGLDAKAGDFGGVEVMSDDSLMLLLKSKWGESSEEERKHQAQQNKQRSPTSPPVQASSVEVKSMESGRPPLKDLCSDLKPRAMVSREVEVRSAMPPVTSQKVAPALCGEGLAMKPKKEEKNEGIGKEVAKSLAEAQTIETTKGGGSSDKGKDRRLVASEPLPESGPTEVLLSANASEKLELGPAETLPSLETQSSPAKPLLPAQPIDSPKAPFTDMNKGACSCPLDQPPGPLPKLGNDQPKKRGNDGKSKRTKNHQPLLLEGKADSRKAPSAEESEWAARSIEAGFSNVVENKTVLGSGGLAEKPKKRSSEGKSRRAQFFLEAGNSSGHLQTEGGSPEHARERTDHRRAGTDPFTASQSLETSGDMAKLQNIATAPGMEKVSKASTRSIDRVDFPLSAYPFILEAPVKEADHPALLEAVAQAKGTVALDTGKGLHALESPTIPDPTSLLPESKPKKRSSDGKSKKSEKSPPEQPFLLETSGMSKPTKSSEITKDISSAAKDQVSGGAPFLEQLGSSHAQLPAAKQTEKDGGKKTEDLSIATDSSPSEQLPASNRERLNSESELMSKTKAAPFTDKGQEGKQKYDVENVIDPLTLHPELVAEEPKKLNSEGQGPQVHSILEAKPELVRPATVYHEMATTEEGKTKGLDHRLKEANTAGPAPVVSFGELPVVAKKEESRKDEPCLEKYFVLGAKEEAGIVLEAEREAKLKECSSPRSKKEGRAGGSEVANKQDPTSRPTKRDSDRKNKKAVSSPMQSIALQAKAEPSKGPGLAYPVGETEFVDENRNIKSLPPGHQVHWEEDAARFFEPFAPSVSPEEAVQGLGCPFLEGRLVGELSKEQPFPPEIPKDANKGDQKDQQELQVNLTNLEGTEAMVEASLLIKAGDETREKRKRSKRPPSDQLLTPDAGSGKDPAICSVSAEGGGMKLLSATQESGFSLTKPPVERVPKMDAGTEGGSFVGRGTNIPSVELPSLWENKKEAATLEALTAALVGGSAEVVTLVESNKGAAEERASGCLDGLGSKPRADKTLEDVPMEEAASADKPRDLSEHLQPDDANKPKITAPAQATSKEEASHPKEALELKEAQSPKPEAGESTTLLQGDQVAKGGKKEAKAKAPPQMKGYMRPTKSRGLPPPSLRVTAQEPGRRRPTKPDSPSLQRQEKAKPEEVKPATEVSTANDIAAPPSKELPPSPDKKAKTPASTPAAKPAAAKAKPVSTTAGTAPTATKRPASATPGQSKKATSPTAGPAAATTTTPKRPTTGSARPSTLTPKDAKPKGTEVKSPEKRTSPSKPPSATTPRPNAKSSPAGPRPSTALSSQSASSPRSTATSPPKRPSTIKTDTKPTDAKKTTTKSPSADLSRPKSAPASTSPSPAPGGAATATSAATGRPKAKPAVPKASGMANVTTDAKKASTLKTAPKTSSAPKPPRPTTSVSAPDLKNVRSKIGSTDNIKHQPGGGRAKVEKKADSAGAARKPELNAVSKMAPTKTAVSKEGAQKQPNGKVQIVSKKANYSHVQSKCGSKDNIKHVPGGGNVPNAPKPATGSHSQPSTAPKPSQGSTNVQILSKKIDLSKVSSKCGSKANIKHKPGGGDVKIENQKLNFKEKAQAKVGSLDNVGHVPAGGTVKTEGGEEAAPQNGAVTAPPPGSGAMQENGVGPAAPVQGSGDQREIQCFDTHIQETSI
ncbi:titin-like isoform X4 [Sceloporus undulatus]|uniref:titin-like isoform X4 n=1 Tax=Sceloporus undulatus TaxID=8520 RepID=UPI001C4C94A0|nr:titin-like isoform X4 [Sceloporus undulatus]